jgi:hypothetical protein
MRTNQEKVGNSKETIEAFPCNEFDVHDNENKEWMKTSHKIR